MIEQASESNAERFNRLCDLLVKAGAKSSDIIKQDVGGSASNQKNIILKIIGSNKSLPAIIVCAHFDTMSGSRGVIDNWSSCVMLVRLSKYLRSLPLKHTFILAGFMGEEGGQIGSRAFVKRKHSWRKANFLAAVNIECLGVGRVRSWSNQSSDELEEIFLSGFEQKDVASRQQVLFGYKSDALSFLNAGIPAITLHSLDGSQLAVINTEADLISEFNAGAFMRTEEQLKIFLTKLDKLTSLIRLKDTEEVLQPVRLTFKTTTFPGSGSAAKGVRISTLPVYSREYHKGLRVGDIITEVDGLRVLKVAQLQSTFRTLYKGKKVEFSLLRSLPGNYAASFNFDKVFISY